MEAFENIVNKDMQSHTERLKNTDAATAANYGVFFIASRPYEIMEIRAVWSTAGASGSTLQIERLTGTTAEGSGDSVLTGTVDLNGTANTVVSRKTVALQNRKMSTGDRLALVDGGTLTSLDNLVVTVLYKPSGKGNYK
jgi:hypothetical protein